MLTIVDSNATPTKSRAYAEAAWAANPSLAPNWWRETLGFTHSKFAYDGRTLPLAPRLFDAGVNVLVSTAATCPVALPEGVQTIVQSADETCVADYLLVPLTGLNTPQIRQHFVGLERRVAAGTLQAYGVVADDLGDAHSAYSFHTLLELAAQAAETAWGRKKRSSLKIILAPLDVLDWGLLFTPNTQHKGEAVSLLELAARLGLMVLVQPHSWPEAQTTPAALQSLTHVAEAEAALHQALQGQWPHVAGQPVFSVLKLLQAGQAPWPTPAVARQWRGQIWPSLKEILQSLPQAAVLLKAYHSLLPQLESLALAAAAPLAKQALQSLSLPPPWQGLTPELQHVALLASVPGVGAVVVPPNLNLAALYALPDIPDIGALLA